MACSGKLSFVGKAVVSIVWLIVAGIFTEAQAQKENTIWYFGNGVGLDFNTSTPTVLSNGAMNAFEGTASTADTQGKLLFYSDGTAVWNKQHQLMANGSGLSGSANSAQSCIIVPKPGSPGVYFLFTTDANSGARGLQYSTIDMSRNGGLGEVVEKNVELYAAVSEQLTAIHHQNKRDIWVISQSHGSSKFRSYLITDNGVNPNYYAHSDFADVFFPASQTPTDAIGCMKVSPDGTMLAVTNRKTNTVRLMSFNNTNGVIGLIKQVPVSLTLGTSPYGVEFSPDSKKLYVSTDAATKIYQYNLNVNDPAQINATGTLIGSPVLDTQTRYVGGSLQLGPDGRIYFAKAASGHLGMIEEPSALGVACKYNDTGVTLPRISGMGLPAFVQSNFYFTYDISYDINCYGQPSSFRFNGAPTDKPTFMEWNFGDPASGTNNTANTLAATHQFSAPGEYTVSFTRHIDNRKETYTITIAVKAPPIVDLGPDRSVCPGTEVTLDASTANATYKWSNGNTSASITTTIPGTYWVDVTVDGCTTRDEVTITNYSLPTVNLGPDRELCQGETIELNAFNQDATYLWQDGSTNPTFTVTGPGTYTVEVTSAEGCKKSDEITIVYNALPVVDLGPDRDICANTNTVLDATQPGVTYKWSTGATTPTITVADAGEYWVTITNSKGCSATDVVRINHLPLPVVNLGPDETLCTGDVRLLNATYPNATYLWQDGSTSSTFMVTEPGKYWVDVTNEFGCTLRDEIWLPYLTRPAIELGNDTTLCFGDTLVIGTELPGGVRYEWQDGSTEAFFKITKPGTYKLKAYNQHCEASDEITVKFKDCVGGLFIPNIITPNGDGKNDMFFIHGLTEDDWELVMYNRWGKEIYRKKNYKNDWAPQPANTTGMFYYLLQHPATGRIYKGWLEVAL